MQGEIAEKSAGTMAKRLLPLVLLLAFAAIALANGWHNYLTLESLARNRDMLQTYVAGHGVQALALYFTIYVGVVALSLPGGALLTIAGGFLFGWIMGGAIVVIAATIGATILFLIARTSLGEPLAAKAGPKLEKLAAGFRQDALHYLLFLRLVPAFPFWLVNLAPALLGVPLATFVLGTLLGIIPGTFAFAFLGAGLDSVITAQAANHAACLAEKGSEDACPFDLELSAIVTPQLLIALAALGIVAIIPVVLRKIRGAGAQG